MKNKTLILASITFFLNVIGLLVLFSALHRQGDFTGRSLFFRQIFWVCLGWVVFAVFCFVNYRVFFDGAWFIYAVVAALLLGVALFGQVRMGARRWLDFGLFSLQPSEFAKLAALFLTARMFTVYLGGFSAGCLDSFKKEVLYPFLPLLAIIFLIYRQPDLGTSLVIIFLFSLMAWGCGMRRINLFIILLAFITCIPVGWHFLKPYQRERIMVFLNPNIDPLGTGYTIIQSKIAIGSGGLLGKGFLAGTQSQLNFIPARHTDFIFTVVAEEWGFVGVCVLLFLYYLLLVNILDIAGTSRDKFGMYLAVGIFSLFFIHIFINIAMVSGLLPVVGIPLAFLSYGGSYYLINFILLGIAVNIYRLNK